MMNDAFAELAEDVILRLPLRIVFVMWQLFLLCFGQAPA